VIVDDHAAFRAQACRTLEAAGFEVVGQAGDRESALAVVAALAPDWVLLDVQLPDSDGFAVAEALEQAGSASRIVLISGRDRSTYRTRLARRPRPFLNKMQLSGEALLAAAGSPL
jgi:DNA-binding NarL/FixJ family response regulator